MFETIMGLLILVITGLMISISLKATGKDDPNDN